MKESSKLSFKSLGKNIFRTFKQGVLVETDSVPICPPGENLHPADAGRIALRTVGLSIGFVQGVECLFSSCGGFDVTRTDGDVLDLSGNAFCQCQVFF